jgi:hypothetical protein
MHAKLEEELLKSITIKLINTQQMKKRSGNTINTSSI